MLDFLRQFEVINTINFSFGNILVRAEGEGCFGGHIGWKTYRDPQGIAELMEDERVGSGSEVDLMPIGEDKLDDLNLNILKLKADNEL